MAVLGLVVCENDAHDSIYRADTDMDGGCMSDMFAVLFGEGAVC